MTDYIPNGRPPPDDFRLPTGWYVVAASVGGYGVYQKLVRTDSMSAGSAGEFFASGSTVRYRVIFNGWMGGWIVDVDRKEGQYLFGGQPFQTAIAAMVATEIELANMGCY